MLGVAEGEGLETAEDDWVCQVQVGLVRALSRTKVRDIRYATMIESWRFIASSATALVKSMVKSTELFNRFDRFHGASRRTFEVKSQH